MEFLRYGQIFIALKLRFGSLPVFPHACEIQAIHTDIRHLALYGRAIAEACLSALQRACFYFSQWLLRHGETAFRMIPPVGY